MKHDCIWKRLVCGLLAVVLVLAHVPIPTRAAGTAVPCEHHSAHTADCGYAEAEAEIVCSHVHDESCNQETMSCVHTEHIGCGYAVEEGNLSCGHVCDKESGCITTALLCGHTADGSCCYKPAKEASPCAYTCAECAKETDPTGPSCVCTAGCADGSENVTCGVCSSDDTKCEFVPALLADSAEAVVYDIYVGSTQITSDNAEDVFGDGTVSYDAESNTLTLKNAGITESHRIESGESAHAYGIYALGDLSLRTEGENTIAAEDSTGSDGCSYGIFVSGALTLDGEGTLTITCGASGENGSSVGIQADAGITVLSGRVTTDSVSQSVNQSGGVLTVGTDTTVASDYTLTADMTLTGTWNFVNGAKLIPGSHTVTNNGTVQVNGEAHTHNETGAVTYAAIEGNSAQHSKTTACDGCPIGSTTTVTEVHSAAGGGTCVCGEIVPASGTCGDNLTWRFENGTLTVSGTGNMGNYSSSNTPWKDLRSAIEKVVIEEGVTSVGNYAFYGCKNLTDVAIPQSVTSIGNYAFQDCDGLTHIEIPEGVTAIGSYAFNGCSSLTSITIPDTVASIDSRTFNDCKNLKYVDMPDGITSIGIYAFSGCSSLTSIEIPESVTSIGGSSFSSCGQLETVVLNAKNCTAVSSNAFSNIKLSTILIGPKVDHFPAQLWAAALPTGCGLAFQGPNYFSMDALPEGNTFAAPLKDLPAGTYFADANGALYRIENGTAVLLYCPPGVTELTVPKELPALGEEGPYPVTGVGSHALICAEDLTSITFESPETIAKLSALAMADCPTLVSVNDESSAAGAKALFANAQIGVNAFLNTGLTDSDADGELTTDAITVSSPDGPELIIETASGSYYTGQTCKTVINVSNPNNVDQAHMVRVYFQFSDPGGTASYPVGQHIIKVNGNEYTIEVCETESDLIYYVDIPQPIVGDTISLNVTTGYPSPSSGGGNVMIWGTVLTQEEAAALGSGITQPEYYHRSTWETKKDVFPVTKETSGTASLAGDGKENGNIYVSKLAYRVSISREGETLEGIGKDYMTSIEYEDILTLPEGTQWREGVLDAIKNGHYRISSGTYYVTVDGVEITLCSAKLNSSSNVSTTRELSLTEDGQNIILKWTVKNNSTTQEMPLYYTTLQYGSEVICVTDPALEGGKTYTFTNDVTAVQHFAHSDDVAYAARAESTVTASAANFTIDKTLESYSGYMGGTANYLISLKNSGALPYAGLTHVSDPLPTRSYLKPENMQAMFDADAADDTSVLSITIQNATLCAETPTGTVTGTDGNQHQVVNATSGVGTQYSGLEQTDSTATRTAVLLLEWAEEGSLLQLSVDGIPHGTIGEGGGYPSIAAALDSIGYLVTAYTQFTPTWIFGENFKLWGGQEFRYAVPSTNKDSFMITDKDVPNYATSAQYPLRNDAYAYYTKPDGQEAYKSDYRSHNVSRDFTLYKAASVNGTAVDKNTTLEEGNLIRYGISLDHNGSASYDALPLVDHLQGGQVLLVPAEGNSISGLEPEEVNGSMYYVLDTPGTYEDVVVGGLLADTVVVTETDSGLSTLIRWYLTDVRGNVTKEIEYDALVAPTRAGSDGSMFYALNNEVWAGDHQSHRLWDTLGIYGARLGFDKSIVTDLGEAVPADDTLAKYSSMKEGETITYRFFLKSVGESSLTIAGSDIYDILPASVNGFWDETDITVRYVAENGEAYAVTNGDHWYVTAESPDGTTQADRQYLRWQDDFQMVIDEAAYIYVTLTCPSGETWQSYAQQYANTRLQNDLVVYGRQDTVYHELAIAAEAVLQKGVYQTGIQSEFATNYTWNTTENSRHYYANNDAYNRLVFYYVTLYNGGVTKLYINDLQDILPRGFTFYGMYSSASGLTTHTSDKSITNASELASAADPDHSSISWRSATVSTATEMLDSGEQKLTFSITDYTTSSSNNLLYDELLEKYYLAPGQGVKFAYACRTNDTADTDDSALNRVVMPYYDPSGAGVTISEDVTITGQAMGQAKTNDGDCALLDNGAAESFGFTGGQSDTQWLSSDVTLLRGNIVPGITKSVESVKKAANGTLETDPAYAEPLDTINWKVMLTNEGEYPITDYTVTDVMQSPYVFTGVVNYNIYPAANDSNYRAQAHLFTILERTDTALTIRDGGNEEHTLTIGGDPVTVTASVRVYYTSSSKSTQECAVEVSLKTDASGNEVLALHIPDGIMSIPEGGRAELKISTNNTTVYENKVFYNTSYLTPNVQSYDTGMVSQGNNTTLDGKPTVRNSCPITVSMGYVTSSEKTVAQADASENSASSSDAVNYIVLPEEDMLFNFTLRVDNTTDKAMENLILIDNLPEVNDHSTFAADDPRFSEFKVSLAEEPNFTVTVTAKDGTQTTLTKDQYRLEFSSKTKFSTSDWNGTSDWEDTVGTQTRAFRVVISDATGTLIPADSSVFVQFSAKIDGEVKPGQTAWNSFGYHYNLVGLAASLEAAPLKVGVRVPNIPEIHKQLTLEDGTTYAAEADETFRFLIYTGTALQFPSGYTEDQLVQSLNEENRSFTYVELTVKAGESVSEALLLEKMVCYTREDSQWTATETAWNWSNGSQYTVLELPLSGQDEFAYHGINGNSSDGYTFTHNQAKKLSIVCVNHRKTWDVTLNKTDTAGTMLPGAVFGLYSPNAADQISEDAYAALNLDSAPNKSIVVEDKTYYLEQVNTTNTKGQIIWTDLLRTEYYICELQAPKGYLMNGIPILVQSANYEDVPAIAVANDKVYVLPKTGGIGTHWNTAGGVLLIAAGLFLSGSMKQKRRKKNDTFS